ncbi:helix-turn-helix domain-containing protein [Bacillus chungangensis]|uniref:Transcriptional regulator with XRE-family HTH domain n=1 Tax=Bacillus chungangensis TaxID=587633 RepID=A0ABT9WT03_9BACI|nr:helix-turn-helix transcriptional regulator [Bacillus chungangensis]MDQ0176345.1 transcriptional regulator with XRE-family HTH domain [Bacillus chungangensis]
MSFGKRLKQLRKLEGISMASLGSHIGTSSSRISDWENEKTHPSSVFIVRIARYFNVSIDWLLTGVEFDEYLAVSKMGDLTNEEEALIHSIVERNEIEDPLLFKKAVSYFCQWMKAENASVSINKESLEYLYYLLLTFVHRHKAASEKIQPNIAEQTQLYKPEQECYPSSDEQHLLLLFRQLSKRDKTEIVSIMEMKKTYGKKADS